MDPLVALIEAWLRIQWVFTTWLPWWWSVLNQNHEWLKRIGE